MCDVQVIFLRDNFFKYEVEILRTGRTRLEIGEA